MSSPTWGFIILRHVNSPITNLYWQESVKCIRQIYQTCKIVIIDDASDPKFLTPPSTSLDNNIIIVDGKYSRRGELLPFIHFAQTRWFDIAVIIHDSVFIKSQLPILNVIDVMPLWHFNYDGENLQNIARIARNLQNTNQLMAKFAELNQTAVLPLNIGIKQMRDVNCDFVGYFGCQCIIRHSFLTHINKKYKLTNLIGAITSRTDRCSLERVFGVLFSLERNRKQRQSLLGSIFKYCKWGYTFDEYIISKNKHKRPVIKVWTGR